MSYTDEETAIIDGVICTFFSGRNVSDELRKAYLTVHQHIQEGVIGKADLKRIASALEFITPERSCSCNQEEHRELVLALSKTRLMLAAK